MSYFYFGEVPEEFQEEHDAGIPQDWEPGWYFRIRVVYDDEEIKVEDSCGRMIPFRFEDIKSLRRALKLAKESV